MKPAPLMFGHDPGMAIRENSLLPAEFYAITDWSQPQASAIPVWFSIWNVDGFLVAHPTVLERLKEEMIIK